MAKIERDIQHSLSLEDAKAAASDIVNKVHEKFGSLIKDIKWNDDHTVADVNGKGFSGKFDISATNVKILIDLGLLTSPFKGKIEEELDKYTEPLTKKA
ncbi:MAG: polyhydroxyalkanoic acid system family protein [Proteobacteria bacterium]|nr:polyhydroxyalkanoic acid system family protein [Pseudomonadota bacterium]